MYRQMLYKAAGKGFLMTKNQSEWPINSVKHSFHSVLIEGAAIMNCELWLVHVPLTFRPAF